MVSNRDEIYLPESVAWPRVQVQPVADTSSQKVKLKVVDPVSQVAATLFFVLSLFLMAVCMWLLWRVWGLAREVRELRALESQRQYAATTLPMSQFTASSSTQWEATVEPSPTPTPVVSTTLPETWEKYAFPDIALAVYAPPGYRSDLKLLDTGEYQARFWQGETPESAKMKLTVRRTWQGWEELAALDRTLRLDKGVYAGISLPPSKAVATQEHYQTEYVFEYQGRAYRYSCQHDWDQVMIMRCNTMVGSLELGR